MKNKIKVRHNKSCIKNVICPGCKSSYIKRLGKFLLPKIIESRLYKCSCCNKFYFKTPYWYKPINISK